MTAVIKHHAHEAQRQASDPHASVWVTANAGSGKTHVLVNRIIRLLLNDVAPERILCLTYTRAAAAEMSNRLFYKLSKWITYDNDALIDLIHDEIGKFEPDAEALAGARRLFTRAMETPGGLKVQTIHAFCEGLLQQFPIEAGVIPSFQVMEEDTAKELLAQARREALSDFQQGQAASEKLVAPALIHAMSDRLDELVGLLLRQRATMRLVWASDAGFAHYLDQLRGYLDIRETDTETAISRQLHAGIDEALYRQASEVMAADGAATNKKNALLASEILEARDGSIANDLMRRWFFKADGQPRADTGVITKTLAQAHPQLAAALYLERDRIQHVQDHLRRLRLFETTRALLYLSRHIINGFAENKRRLGFYDYDDLIERTLTMFRERPDAAWVLFRLDGGLDHVLIDEAQDTSPDQWEIIRFLTDEFFAGEGQRSGSERTIFVVGDRKQSIFSFQGADPAAFDRMYEHFKARARDAQAKFNRVALEASFRSGAEILAAVDKVFALPGAAKGVQPETGEREVHAAIRDGDAGRIEIWPMIGGKPKQSASVWEPARDVMIDERPKLAIAQRVAENIKGWLDSANPEILKSKNRPLRYGDILILVRTRTNLMDALVRALKQRNIPVAGADRIKLNQHIAVQDLKAAAQFCLMPEDDLNLATLLKSPLLARDDGEPFNDDDLVELCHDRAGISLWRQFQRTVDAGVPGQAALQRLKTWLNRISVMPVYEFFTALLINDDGRRRLLARLGTEASEPIDAFLNLALEFDRDEVSSMMAFLKMMDAGGAEIKRDMEQGSDAVRIMTVHAAKGLEANVVILPDTCEKPANRSRPEILFDPISTSEDIALVGLPKNQRPELLDTLSQKSREREREEYNRLLYVAMTRARDRLCITGFHRGEEAPEGSWYDLVTRSLLTGDAGDVVEILRDPAGEITGWRIERPQEASTVAEDDKSQEKAVIEPVDPPDWAWCDPPVQPAAANWVAPSRLTDSETDIPALQPEQFQSPLDAAGENRFQRGNIIHALLQYLPGIAADQQAAIAEKIAAQKGTGLPAQIIAEAIDEALAIMQDPRLSDIFGRDSRAEVPVAALIKDGDRQTGMTGQIDRLVVRDKEVLIIDYKTNRPPPQNPAGIPVVYRNQMTAYRSALQRVYPDKRIRCFLLWTNAPSWMEL